MAVSYKPNELYGAVILRATSPAAIWDPSSSAQAFAYALREHLLQQRLDLSYAAEHAAPCGREFYGHHGVYSLTAQDGQATV